MSFEDASPGTVGEVDVSPDTGDAGGETTEPEAGAEAPARQYVEIDDPDNRYERVKVDGEDVEVPYSELKRGYSREADYTRKTQELAQQRQEAEFGLRLQRALEANPALTLQALAQQYGMTVAQAQAAQAAAEEEDYADPLEREIAKERAARLALEDRISQREADEQLDRAVNGLRSQFQLSDEDLREVVGTAMQMGLGIEAFPLIYKTMQFDRINARVQAHRTEQERVKAETARREAAKTQASQIISNGSSGGNGLTDRVDAGGKMSLREAIEAAFEQAERG